MKMHSIHSPRSRGRRAAQAALACLMVVALAACSGSGSGSNDGGKPTLTVGLGFAPASLDPAKDTTSWAPIRSLTNEALMHRATDGSVEPGLATKWRYIGTDGKNFELTLRKDAVFSDGEKVDSAAVKKWLEYFTSSPGIFAKVLGDITSIDTPDQWTVQIHLASPNRVLPIYFTESYNVGFVTSPKSIDDPQSLASGSFGAGQYQVDTAKSVSGSQYTLVPNEHYYDKSKQVWGKVIVKVLPDAPSRFNAIQTGQIDVASPGDNTTADAAEKAGLNVAENKTQYVGLAFLDRNGKINKALGDPRVRQALNYAVDRKAIAKAYLGDRGVPTSQMSSADGSVAANDNYYPYDPAKAKALLAEAGYPNGFSFKVLNSAAMNFIGAQTVPLLIAKYLGEVGVKMTIVPTGTVAELFQKRASAKYEAIYQTNSRPDPMFLQYSLQMAKDTAANPFHAVDPGMDALMAKAAIAENPSDIWKQMSLRTQQQAYFMPVSKTIIFQYSDKKASPIVLGARGQLDLSELTPAKG